MDWYPQGGGGGGAPEGPAGGGLEGTFPNPIVTDDGHSHTAATLPATMPPSVHATAHEVGGGDVIDGNLALALLDVDNLRLDANTISAQNENGSINLTPNGTGGVQLPASTAFDNPNLRLGGLTNTGLASESGAQIRLWVLGTEVVRFLTNDSGRVSSPQGAGFTGLVPSATVPSIGPEVNQDSDTGLGRAAADQLSLIAGGVEIARCVEGVAGVSDGMYTFRPVEANTAVAAAPNLLAVTESRKLLTNQGATAENYHTLPLAAAGLEFMFYCQDTDGIRIVANTDDTIRNGATVSAAAGFIRTATAGNVLHLVAINATEWIAVSVTGTWTIDS